MELLKDRIYEIVKGMIISCELEPGSFISETDLEKKLKVSRTPLREAFSRLEQENLLKVIPKKGVQVKNLSLTTINFTYETRLLLGPFILENYWQEINRDEISKLLKLTLELMNKIKPKKELNKQIKDIHLFFDLDDRFHHTITMSCDNDFLREALIRAENEVRRTRVLIGKDSRYIASANEHIRIMEDILNDKKEDAKKDLITHLSNSKDIALKSMNTKAINYR